jgi:hypothetical protein
MKIKILTLLLIFPFNLCFSQIKKEGENIIGFSIPILHNNSNGVFYSLGNKKEPTGNALSYGLNLNYSRLIYKNWVASVGVGYFKQSFNIIRPFYFDGDTLTNLLYSTKKYDYYCLILNVGFGYRYTLNEKLKLNGFASINLLNSFKQKYTPTGYSGFEHKKVQTNKKSLQIGYIVNISPGIEYILSKKICVGADVIIPVKTKWKNDEIFIKSFFGDDSQKIAENRFSIGTMLSCKYHF